MVKSVAGYVVEENSDVEYVGGEDAGVAVVAGALFAGVGPAGRVVEFRHRVGWG